MLPGEHGVTSRDHRSTDLTSAISVAYLLEREAGPTIKEWLRRVNLVPELLQVSLSDRDRTGHLPNLFHDLTCRLRLGSDAPLPVSLAAAKHGAMRSKQGYSAAMLIEESRVLQVVTFRTLHLHQSELDQNQILLDIMVIADEVDAQLMEAVRNLVGGQPAEAVA